MLKKSLRRYAFSLRLPGYARSPARPSLAGRSRLPIPPLTPLRWEAQGLPSVACPLDGVTVHRTVIGFRLAPAFFNAVFSPRGGLLARH